MYFFQKNVFSFAMKYSLAFLEHVGVVSLKSMVEECDSKAQCC